MLLYSTHTTDISLTVSHISYTVLAGA